MNKAVLVFEDGLMFEGLSIGAKGETTGELVFNTSHSGYQEILTDPSYAGQIMTMTYPLIGNYGVNEEDVESNSVHVAGFIVKELSRIASNFRSTGNLQDYLADNNIVGIENVDTRAIAKHLRSQGAMRGIISTEDFDKDSLLKKVKASPLMEGSDWASKVSTKEPYVYSAKGDKKFTIAAIDCGIKLNILRIFANLGCEVHVFPSSVTAEELLAIQPDGVFVSNGPGDPAAVKGVAETVQSLIGKLPMFGICLGHQIISLALGGKTFKLKFGHRGGNHPVQCLSSGKVDISAQNHGFCVDMQSFPEGQVEMTHINLNDQTAEGMRHLKHPLYSIQYHPEASPGPHESQNLFKPFMEMMERCQQNA